MWAEKALRNRTITANKDSESGGLIAKFIRRGGFSIKP